MLDHEGRKLSKSEGAAGLNPDRPVRSIRAALQNLGQQPPAEPIHAGLADVCQWALENWDLSKVSTVRNTIRT